MNYYIKKNYDIMRSPVPLKVLKKGSVGKLSESHRDRSKSHSRFPFQEKGKFQLTPYFSFI